MNAATILLIGWWSAVGAEDTSDADDAVKPIVRDVHLDGAHHADAGKILDGLETRGTWRMPFATKHRLDPAALRRDLERVATWYRAHGYFQVAVTEAPLTWDTRGAAHVVLHVEEGERSHVRSVQVEGLDGVVWGPDVEVCPGAPLHRGRPFRLSEYEAAKEQLRAALDQSGYLRAELAAVAQVVEEKHAVDVRIEVKPGDRYTVGSIVVEGSRRVSAKAVRRTLDLRHGTLLTGTVLKDARQRLMRTGAFRAVDVEVNIAGGVQVAGPGGTPEVDRTPEFDRTKEDPTLSAPGEGSAGAASGAPHPVVLHVRVDDGPPRYLRLAAGYEISPESHGPRVRATWGHENFLGDLRTLELSNEASYRFLTSNRQGFALQSRLGFMQPGMFEQHTRLESFIEYRRRFEQAFTTNGATTGVGLARKFGTHVDTSVGYQIEATAFEGPPPADVVAEPDFVDPYLLSSVIANLIVADRDDPLFPTRGWSVNLFVRDAGGPVLRGDFEFVRFEPSVHAFVPVAENRVVVAGRAEYGFIIPYGPDGGVPLTHRFYAGGPTNARAWGFGRLAPRSTVDPSKPIGGRSLFFASAETRVRAVADLWMVPFFDVANVEAVQFGPLLRDPSYGTGLGAMYRTPIGPLRVDFGWRLNAQEGRFPGESRWAVNLSFGSAF